MSSHIFFTEFYQTRSEVAWAAFLIARDYAVNAGRLERPGVGARGGGLAYQIMKELLHVL